MRLFVLLLAPVLLPAADLRLGIVGTDTSHAPAFTRLLNDPGAPNHVAGARVVAAFPGGSPDLESSHTRVQKYAEELRAKHGVEIVNSIAELCQRVDAVLLESVDGRVHLEQARQIIAARKPLFIDKPLAASLADAQAIARLAKEAGVPWFSSSSLRYSDTARLRAPDVTGALVWGPGPTDPTHKLSLSWYGIHAVEMLYTLLGSGCREVRAVRTEQMDEVTCRWDNNRLGTVRTLRPYGDFGAIAFRGGKASATPLPIKSDYGPLVREVIKFFQTGKAPVPPEETLEIFAFMDAADRSLQAGGAPIKLP